jgi:hypothetical protein
MDDIRVKFEPGEVDKCQKFAEEVTPTSMDCYKDRGQEDRLHSIRQHREGKLAEFISYRYLRDRGFTLEPPDLNVYNGEGKSWRSDLLLHLPDRDLKIAVKSQSLDKQKLYTASWIFGYADKDGIQSPKDTDEMFYPQYQKNVLIVPVTISKEHGGGVIRAAVMAEDVVSEIEKSLPVLPHLQNSKRVLYGDCLKSLPEEFRWRWPFNERS